MRQILMTSGGIPASTLSLDARDFFQKILKMRARLIAERKGAMNQGMITEFTHARNWFNHWDPNSQQCASYISKHQQRILTIIPGKGCSAHESLIQEFNSIVSCFN